MKRIKILFALIYFINIMSSFAQEDTTLKEGYYPLEVGNKWEYRDRYDNSYQYTVQTFTDSIMSNGFSYVFLCGKRDSVTVYTRYFRQYGSRLYKYSTFENKEFLWGDFSKKTGDTVSVNYYTNAGDTSVVTVFYMQVVNMFGNERKQWGFYEKYLGSNLDKLIEVTDSIGITYEQYIEANFFNYLSGAVINGVKYGNITNVRNSKKLDLSDFIRYDNYPNPFNSSTVISLLIPEEENVNVIVFDILGREIKKLFTGRIFNKNLRIIWNGKNDFGQDVPSGIYIYRIEINNNIRIGKMVLMR
jgi:hypothetical protein